MVNTTDEVYIQAPPEDVYRALLTLGKDAAWWPGAKTTSSGKQIMLSLPAGTLGRITIDARVDNVRPDEGLTWLMTGRELRGRGEWWLESQGDGTAVHYTLEAEEVAGRERKINRHRSAIRRGMNALKDELERS